MNQSIYVIRSESGPVKVGISSQPRLRLSEFRISSPVPLHLDYIIEVEGDAHVLEQRTHAILATRRMCGEWFNVESHTAVAAVVRAAKELRLSLLIPSTAEPREKKGEKKKAWARIIMEPSLAQPEHNKQGHEVETWVTALERSDPALQAIITIIGSAPRVQATRLFELFQKQTGNPYMTQKEWGTRMMDLIRQGRGPFIDHKMSSAGKFYCFRVYPL
jgi:hypothetical protein